MLISYKYKFIFIHNYKVAGSSVKDALKSCSLESPFLRSHYLNAKLEKYAFFRFLNRLRGRKGHLDKFTLFKKHDKGKDLKNKLSKDIWTNFFKFGFVRNPWDWQVSLYHFMLKSKNHFQHNQIKKLNNFDSYIKWRVNKNLKLQKEYFYDEKNNCLVDFIGKIENIDEDFNEICNKIGIKATMPHKNQTKHKQYQEYYNLHTRELIAKNFREDIELFNYQF